MSDEATGAVSTGGESAGETASAPTSVDQALDQSYASSMAPSAPETTEPAAQEGIAPTTEVPQQADAVEGATPTGTEGPIPFQVHKTALDNARTKERETVMTQLQQEMAPYADVLQAVIQDEQSGDIAGFNRILERYAQNPALKSKIASLFGRMLGQYRGQAQARNDSEPEADLQSSDGSLVYSAPQLKKWQEWNNRQVEAKFQQQLQPFQQMQKQHEHTVRKSEIETASKQWATGIIGELSANPDFKPHEADVAARFNELYAQHPPSNQEQWSRLVYRAWNDVYTNVVVPKKVAQQQETFRSAAVKKSLGSTADPSASAAAQPRRFRSIDEALDASFEGVSSQ